MTSPQTQRYQDRLARQRGAGTHKVANAGFTIKPLAPAPAPAPQPPTVNPKLATPVQAPPRRSSRSASRNDSPIINAPSPATREMAGPSPLREGATASFETSKNSQAPQITATAARRTLPRGVGTPTVLLPEGGAAAPATQSGTPVSRVSSSRASTKSTVRRPPAVAEVTPVARGKRMRQPSPDKFLTPDAAGASGRIERDLFIGKSVVETEVDTEDEDAGDVTREVTEDITMAVGKVVEEEEEGGEEEEEEEEEAEAEAEEEDEEAEEEEEEDVTLEVEEVVDDETEDEAILDATAEMEDATMEVEDEIEDELDDTVGGVVEDTTIDDVEDEPEDPIVAIKSPVNRNKRRRVTLEERGSETEDVSLGLIGEPVVDVETPNPKRKRQTAGKRPAPPQAPEIRKDGETLRSRPRKVPTKPHATTRPKPKPKPHQHAEHPDDEHLELLPFHVEVHRFRKSGNFTLPPGSQRAGVNTIDVVNQVSMDFIDSFYPKLKSNTQRNAVENFKEELSLRFLELTDAVENNIVLTTRVKQAQKRKAQLMLELLGIKQDRAKVAVKMDDVRRAHELATKSSEIQQHVSKTFEDISGTLERGKARKPEDGEEISMDGLEALVRKVSVAVTGGDGTGTGLLATVVEFNRFLEKTERALSGRRRRD